MTVRILSVYFLKRRFIKCGDSPERKIEEMYTKLNVHKPEPSMESDFFRGGSKYFHAPHEKIGMGM